MTLHIFELPKFERIMKTGQMNDALGEWLHFFNHADTEDKTMRTAYKNPVIHKAFGMLETLSADETVRHLARVREDALRNERSELFYAEKRGEKRGEFIGKINLAQRLLKRPVTPENDLIGKSLKELGTILKQLEAELNV